jgi:hypothetical protein
MAIGIDILAIFTYISFRLSLLFFLGDKSITCDEFLKAKLDFSKKPVC